MHIRKVQSSTPRHQQFNCPWDSFSNSLTSRMKSIFTVLRYSTRSTTLHISFTAHQELQRLRQGTSVSIRTQLSAHDHNDLSQLAGTLSREKVFVKVPFGQRHGTVCCNGLAMISHFNIEVTQTRNLSFFVSMPVESPVA
jgi:hypothetical protein